MGATNERLYNYETAAKNKEILRFLKKTAIGILIKMRGNAALLRLVKLRIEMWLCAARQRERT